jgi:hypothetical protein
LAPLAHVCGGINMFNKEQSKPHCANVCSARTNCVLNGIITLHPPLTIKPSKFVRYKDKVCFKNNQIISNVIQVNFLHSYCRNKSIQQKNSSALLCNYEYSTVHYDIQQKNSCT